MIYLIVITVNDCIHICDKCGAVSLIVFEQLSRDLDDTSVLTWVLNISGIFYNVGISLVMKCDSDYMF